VWAQVLVAPGQLRLIDLPPRTSADLGPGQLLVRVLAGGICGSDIPLFSGYMPVSGTSAGYSGFRPPGYPLHEIMAEVVASTSPVAVPGDRVVGWASRNDGMAELVITDAGSVVVVDTQQAIVEAVMLQPLACVLAALDRLPTVRGRAAAVIGLGPIGALFCHALKAKGARSIVGVDRVDRRDIAALYGIDEVVWASADQWASRAKSDEVERPELVIEAVGRDGGALDHALHAVRTGGVVYAFGMPTSHHFALDLDDFYRRNVTLISGTTADRRQALEAACRYLAATPELTELYFTHHLSFADAQEGFDAARNPRTGQMKLCLLAP